MRLLVITNDYPPKPGGIQMYLRNLVDAYPDPVHVFAPSDPGAEAGEEGVTRGARAWMLPTPSVRRRVSDVVDRFRPDAVLFGAPHPLTSLGPGIREEFDIPFGVLSHGAEITIPGALPLVGGRLGRALAKADVRFAVSRFTANKVEQLAGAPCVFMGAGVEIDTFTPAEHPPSNRVPVIGCVSRFVPRKGQERVLEAAAMLDREVEVLLVGKGRTEGRLRKKAASLGITTRFAVDVPWEDLAELYRGMDVFVMPCRSRLGGLEVEGLGLVFLEASASGLPVIAGDSGGSPETVQEGRTGFVATSAPDIARHLATLLDDPSAARRMGAAGRDFVVAEFTWERVVDRMREGFAAHIR